VKSIVGMHIEGSFFFMIAFFLNADIREEKKREEILLCEMRRKKETMMMTDCFPLWKER
jgi:hypothetical protein